MMHERDATSKWQGGGAGPSAESMVRCADCQREADHALDDARLTYAASGDPRQLEPDLSRVRLWSLVSDLHDEGAS